MHWKDWYFGHLVWRANSLEKTLMLGKIEGKRRTGWQRIRWLDGIADLMDMNLSKLQEIVKDKEPDELHFMQSHSRTWLGEWTTATCTEALGARGKEPSCQCRRCKRCGFDSWVGKIPWVRAWQPAPVFLPRESRGQRSLSGYSPWDHKESDMTEAT